jgi:outer membrane protein assembly factor BamB
MNSRLLRSVMLVTVTLIAFGAVAGAAEFGPRDLISESAAPADDWPQTGHDAGSTGFNAGEHTITRANVSRLQQVWAGAVPGGVTSFASTGGMLFAAAQGTGGVGILTALNATTGATRWTTTIGTSDPTEVAAAGGDVFAQCQLRDTGGGPYGGVCAYSQRNGHLIWSYGNPCNCAPESGLDTVPVYKDGVVYFGYGVGGCCSSNSIVAVSAATGAPIWSTYVGGNNSIPTQSLVVGPKSVFFICGTNSGHAVCSLSRASGALQWSTLEPSQTPFGDALAVAGDVVYSTTNNAVSAFHASTGTLIWSDPTNGGVGPVPVAVAYGRLYVTLRTTNGQDTNLYALNAKTGAMVWENPSGSVSSAPSVANGVVYATGYPDAGARNAVVAYSAATGATLWVSPLEDTTLDPAPIVANGRLYVATTRSGDPVAYALPAALSSPLRVRR